MILTHGANSIATLPKPVYETDFSNFDIATGIDIPQIGLQTQYNVTNPSGITKKDIVIDGNVKNVLSFSGSSSIYIQQGYIRDEDDYTVVCEVYLENIGSSVSFGSLLNNWLVCPAFNGVSGRYGKILVRFTNGKPYSLFNGFYNLNEDFYYSDSSEFQNNLNKKIIGGVSKKSNQLKAFLQGKKVGIVDASSYSVSRIGFYNQSGNTLDALKLSIYKNVDLFEQME